MIWLEEHTGKAVSAFLTLVAAGFAWIVRTVFTNNKRLDLLEQKQDMQHQEITGAVTQLSKSNDTALATQERMFKMLEKLTEIK